MSAPAYHESLPYIDPAPSPESQSAARALIASEPPPSNPTALPPIATLSLTPALTTELDRIASQTPLQPLSLSRYEAPPTPEPDASPDNLSSILCSAYVSSSYLSSRLQNLQLLDAFGKNSWLLANYQLEDELRQLEKELADTKAEIDEVNAARQTRQTDVKGEMELLEEGWKKGVGRVLETELAVEELKEQIRQEMRQRAGGIERAP